MQEGDLTEGGRLAVVFGGAGFIGTHLTSLLRESGYDAVVADVSTPSKIRKDVRYESVDVTRQIELEAHEPAIVFNLAAVHRTPGHPENEYYDTNVGGSLNITKWCERVGAKTLVFTSSISVYGPTETPKSEADPLLPTSSYGRSKLLAETIHTDWVRRGSSRRLAIARPAVVFGPGENGNFTRLARALKRRTFAYPGRHDTVKGCGYVHDMARALMFAAHRDDAFFLFNYCYPRLYTIREICEAFNDVAGYPLPPMAPQPLISSALSTARVFGRGAGRALAQRVQKLTASTNIHPAALIDAGFEWETDLRSALQRWWETPPEGEFV